MKYSILFLTLLLNLKAAFTQNKTFTISLFYAINEVESNLNFNRLDSMLTAESKNTLAVNICGYADFLCNDAYNKDLSLKRANAIKDYLLKKNPSLNVIKCVGVGEKNSYDNSSILGEPSQRRVDVIVAVTFPRKRIGERENITQKKDKPVAVGGPKNLITIEKGESMSFEGLNFIPGRHVIVKTAIPILESVLETLKEHPNLKIEIQGHICCEPGNIDGLDLDTQEMNLSENRALAIYNYLVRNGIDEDRLTYKGYGHTQPKIKIEKSPEDEQMNRRVEFKIIEN
ncbi:OmpA family protein [Aurantibacillus circumpalustris]|uniref:OmpA family protein n=1 Tax=Aurantibacillus circumpalustris TaxID=3036359 RepID=UPI00295ADB47|nr:OmpA family protein [Aurantibacillus circumpalustris]